MVALRVLRAVDRPVSRPVEEEKRTCCACGAIDPAAGLRLGPDEGGAHDLWFCRDAVACVERCTVIERGEDLAGYERAEHAREHAYSKGLTR